VFSVRGKGLVIGSFGAGLAGTSIIGRMSRVFVLRSMFALRIVFFSVFAVVVVVDRTAATSIVSLVHIQTRQSLGMHTVSLFDTNKTTLQ